MNAWPKLSQVEASLGVPAMSDAFIARGQLALAYHY